MSEQPIKFERLMALANILFKSIGMEPYDYGIRTKMYCYMLFIVFAINLVNMNLVLISELIYVLLAFINSSNIVEAIMNLSYIGFVFVGDIKILSIYFAKDKITALVEKLTPIYPNNIVEQQEYRVQQFLSRYTKISLFFVLTHLTLIWTYNLFPIISYFLYDYWLQTRQVGLTLPYFCYVPWDWHGHWTYSLLYASQNLAGHTCMSGQLGSDLLLCCIVTQVIMHFQYLARTIRNHTIEYSKDIEHTNKENIEFLKRIINYHQKILDASDTMNKIFGVPLLVNFLSSSFIICFLGFQASIGKNTDNMIMLMLFLFCSLIQVYMISNYGQELILASQNIGNAVYEHDWQNSSLEYRKMTVLIIKRSQKPSILKATTFLNISLGTMTDLIQLSYKFFALLRTMYSD